MSEAYLLQTVVKGPAQTGFSSPVKFYESEELVREAIKEHLDNLNGIINTGKILIQTDKGPRAALSVLDLFAMLGITNVAATFCKGEVRGSVLVAGRAPIIITG